MSLHERYVNWRNARLSNPKFQEFAASFPLTRMIAQRRAARAFDLTAGFVYTQILRVCVDVNLLEHLREGPLSLATIAEKTDLPLAGADRLIRASASLDLVQRVGDQYALGAQGAALLGNSTIFAMIKHHDTLYDDLRNPTALLRDRGVKTQLSGFWDYESDGDFDYSNLMAQTQAMIAAEVMRAYSFAWHTALLDVGGGSGAFLCAAKKRFPHLNAQLCDLPNVTRMARQRFAEEGVEAGAHDCNFLNDPIPTGADVISLIRILHDHEDEEVCRLLRAIRQALPHKGTLLIAEPMAETPGARPMGEAYFGMYLWAMGRGRPRSFRELRALLNDTGFEHAALAHGGQPVLAQIIVAS